MLGRLPAGQQSPLARLPLCCTPLSRLVGVSVGTERGRQQDNSLANGCRQQSLGALGKHPQTLPTSTFLVRPHQRDGTQECRQRLHRLFGFRRIHSPCAKYRLPV